MSAQAGVRERKKRETRDRIAATATRLFVARGFDGVTVAEIAREAHVAQKTVFNYFATKEDLFYSRVEPFEENLLSAIRDRAPGRSFVDAFRGFLLTRQGVWGKLAPDDAGKELAELQTVARIITESPALLAREDQIFSRCTESLAALLAAEARRDADDVELRVVASALIGVHRALVDYTRRRILAGVADPALLLRDLRIQTMRALRPLSDGLDAYGTLLDTGAWRPPDHELRPAGAAAPYTRRRWRSWTSNQPVAVLGSPGSGAGRSRYSGD
jgi:AcrR family transcriptional regulator